MKPSILLTIVLLASTSFAAIGRTGTCTASTTSCTFTATATGDIKVVFAYRSGSVTAPTLPVSGWTSISTRATASGGGTLGSMTVGCNVSSSSADTGSGTWTNASLVVGVSYSGSAVNVTADCNTTGIGVSSGLAGKTQTSLTSGFVSSPQTLNDANSWVSWLVGASATTCIPSALNSRATIGAGPAGAVADAGPMGTYSTSACTVSSETYIEETVEIKAAAAAATCSHNLRLLGVGCS